MVRLPNRLFLLAILGLALGWGPAPAHAQHPAAGLAAAAAQPEPGTIVVTGRRLRGAVAGDVPPERELDERDVASFGTGTVAELLDAIEPQTRGSAGEGGGRPAILVDGRRVSSLSEIVNIASEAIERIDILPEEVALRFGFRQGRRAVNIVLRRRYDIVAAELALGAATDGGRSAGEASLNFSRTTERGRWNLVPKYQRSDMLLESERPILGGPGALRSLLAAGAQGSLDGSYTRDFAGGSSLILGGRAEARNSRALVGPSLPADPAAPPLQRRLSDRSIALNASLNGSLGAWQWSGAAAAAAAWNRTRTDLPAAADGPQLAQFESRSANLELFASGPLARLPAGDLIATFRLLAEAQSYHSSAALAGTEARSELSRRQGTGHAGLVIPLARRGTGGLGAIGTLSANAHAELEWVSDFGTLRRYGAGLTWSPVRVLSLSASLADEDQVPSVQELGDPRTVTPNVRIFDFTRSESAQVSLIEGGNADLSASNRRLLRLGATARPLARENLLLSATWSRTRTRNPVALLGAVTPELETAFPERFTRGPDGRLLALDVRPLNFARAEREDFRWGFSWSLPLPAASRTPSEPRPVDLRQLAGHDRSGRLQLSFHHSMRLRDEVLIAAELPPTDYLDGAAAGPRGGRPRHQFELQAALFTGGIGARIDANFESGTQVRTATANPGAGRTLTYPGIARLNLRLFADLGDQPALMRPAPWLQGTRLSIGIDNLFNARPRVRDEAGDTPRALQPAYLDPLGRTVRVSLRRRF